MLLRRLDIARRARRLHLNLDHPTVIRVGKHGEDVGALQSVPRQRRRPATSGQLRRNVMLPDGLRLLGIRHSFEATEELE